MCLRVLYRTNVSFMSRVEQFVYQALNGKAQPGLATLFVRAIFQGEFTAVSLGDLAAED